MKRKGAVAPLFAVLLPVLVLLCGFAINVAYMQLVRTELHVATDASARAGGVAFSELQDVDQALSYVQSTAALNRVAARRYKSTSVTVRAMLTSESPHERMRTVVTNSSR